MNGTAAGYEESDDWTRSTVSVILEKNHQEGLAVPPVVIGALAIALVTGAVVGHQLTRRTPDTQLRLLLGAVLALPIALLFLSGAVAFLLLAIAGGIASNLATRLVRSDRQPA